VQRHQHIGGSTHHRSAEICNAASRRDAPGGLRLPLLDALAAGDDGHNGCVARGALYLNNLNDLNETERPARPRRCDANAAALAAARTYRQTLATFAGHSEGERGFVVPYSSELNPPLWELGHVGWFQEWWLRRNPQRDRGVGADPEASRLPPRRSNADALFDSGRVAHDTRWQLPLPGPDALRDDLAQGL
jgi:hypothetical protein